MANLKRKTEKIGLKSKQEIREFVERGYIKDMKKDK